MRFIKSKESELHSNYVSRVIRIKEEDFSPHPHPDVTKLKCYTGHGQASYGHTVLKVVLPFFSVFFRSAKCPSVLFYVFPFC